MILGNILGTNQIAGEIKELKETLLNEFGKEVGEKSVNTGFINQIKNTLPKAVEAFKVSIQGLSSQGLNGFQILTKSSGAFIKTLWSGLSVVSKFAIGIGAVVAVGTILYKIYDDLNISTEEYREKLKELKSDYSEIESELKSLNNELQTTQKRLSELSEKDTLTFTEKEEYDNLVKQNNELQRKIDLLELEQQTKNAEKNKTFVDTMNSDTKSNFEYAQDSNGNIFKGNAVLYSLSGESYSHSNEEEYINQQFKEREKNLLKIAELEDKLKSDINNEALKREKERLEKNNKEIDIYLKSKSTQWAADSDGINYISDPNDEHYETTNKWLDYIADFQDRMAIAMGGTNAKTNAFNRLVDNWVFDETVQGLQDLGKEGKVTADLLENPAYDKFIDKLVEIGFIDSEDNLDDIALAFNNLARAADEAVDNTNKVLTNVQRLGNVQSLSKGFDQLDKIYADVLDGKEFDYSSILNNDDFKEVFDDYEEEYSNFIETISKSPKDINACQDAFDKLATAYIYDKAALKDVTEETKEATVTMLKQMGVSNADIIVKEQLAINTVKLADAQEDLNELKDKGVDASIDLENATAVELISLINEAEQTGYNVEALQNYLLKKIQSNQITISTSGDIQNLANLCGRLGIAGEALKTYAALKEATLGVPYASGQSKNSLPTLGVSNLALNDPTVFVNEVNNKISEAKNNQAKIDALEAELQKALVDFANGNYKTTGKYTGGDASNSAKENLKKAKQSFDWVEKLISNIQRKITNLGKTVSATYKNWTTRNSELAKQLSAVNSEIDAQNKAASTYWAKANSVGLSQHYKDLVNSGNYSIQDITDEDLKEKIQKYEEWANKAKAAEDAVIDLKAELANLAKTKFDNVISAFDDELSVIEHRTSMIEGELNQIEAQGYLASTKYYDKLISLENENIGKLSEEYKKLKEEFAIAMSAGNIEKYSSDWYEMQGKILDVESALQEANTQLIEYKNNLRELEWSIFDKAQEMISQIQGESDWLIDLMSNEKMYDDNGNWTEYADATAGLHAVNYNTYMSQADDYAKEIEEINKDLAKDPYNTLLLERRQELLEAQRDMISSAEDEKQAMKDLVAEGYNTMLEALQEMVDKRKEALQAEKDLYDYEKTIAEKTKNIGSLEKQLQSYDGDDSEETQAKVQQIKVELEAAREDLEQTEYERWKSDQEQMLDTLVDDTEQWINERLDNLNEVIREVIEKTNSNKDEINATLTEVTDGVGTTLTGEMEKIWGADGTVVTEYGKFGTQLSSVNTTLTSIKDLIVAMQNASNKEASKDIANVESNVNKVQSTQPASSATPSTPSTNNNNSNNQNVSKSNSKWGSWFVKKVFNGNTNNLNKERSIVDRLKWKNIASDMANRAKYYEAMGLGSASSYRGTSSQNIAMLKLMKQNGYKTGSRRINKDGLNWIHDGEIVYRPSDGGMLVPLEQNGKVYTKEMANNLFDFAKNPSIFSNLTTATLPKGITNNGMNSNVQNDVVMNITLPGVQDVDGFINELRNNKRFEKVVQSMTIGTINPKGSNSFNKFKY